MKNVVPYKFAVSKEEGVLNLSLNSFGSGRHSLFRLSKEKVKAITLDKLREIIGEKIDLIKIDTEGSEYPILIGGKECIKKDKPVFIIETHPWYDSGVETKIVEFLKNMEYRVKIKKM